MKKATLLFPLLVVLLVGYGVANRDESLGRPNRSVGDGAAQLEDERTPAAESQPPKQRTSEVGLSVWLRDRENAPDAVTVEVSEIQSFSRVQSIASQRIPTGVSAVTFPLVPQSRDRKEHLLLILVRDVGGHPLCAQRLLFRESRSTEVTLEPTTAVSVYVDKAQDDADLLVTYRSDSGRAGHERFVWSRRSRVRERETHAIGSFPSGTLTLQVIDGDVGSIRTVRLAGEKRHVDLVTPQMTTLGVELAGKHRGPLKLTLSSRSKRRMLAEAAGDTSADPPGLIRSRTVRAGQSFRLRGLTGERFRVTVLDFESPVPRVLWQRENVRPASENLRIDLENPEGEVNAGQIVDFVPSGNGSAGCGGSVSWHIYVDGYVVEGSAPWQKELALPPVRGAAELVFVPNAACADRFAATRWVFWTSGSDGNKRRLAIPRAQVRSFEVDSTDPPQALLIMSGNGRPLRIDLTENPHLVGRGDGLVVRGIPAGGFVLLDRSGADSVASRTATWVIHNESGIPRAIRLSSAGGTWRSPKNVVVPPHGSFDAKLPVIGTLTIVERVPRVTDTGVSMGDLALDRLDTRGGPRSSVLR